MPSVEENLAAWNDGYDWVLEGDEWSAGWGGAEALVQASSVQMVRNSSEIAPYLLLLVVLLIRPEGLFGEKRIERV